MPYPWSCSVGWCVAEGLGNRDQRRRTGSGSAGACVRRMMMRYPCTFTLFFFTIDYRHFQWSWTILSELAIFLLLWSGHNLPTPNESMYEVSAELLVAIAWRHQNKMTINQSIKSIFILLKFYSTVILLFYLRYDSAYLTCSKKLTGSQLSLPHGINRKLKSETKNKMMSVISPVRSRYREAVQ